MSGVKAQSLFPHPFWTSKKSGSAALTGGGDKGTSADVTMKYVQAPPLSCKNHSGLCSLVCKHGIPYRDMSEMMQERGVNMDASTIFRWVQCYAPELEKRVRWYQGYRSGSWRVDETYIRVGGQWNYLFWAVDKRGELINFMLLDRRDTGAAYRFLGKALKTMRRWPPHSIITTSLAPIPKPSIGCGVNVN
jgi:hypothetical protein